MRGPESSTKSVAFFCNLCRAAIKYSSSMTNLVRRGGETLYFILIFYSEACSLTQKRYPVIFLSFVLLWALIRAVIEIKLAQK